MVWRLAVALAVWLWCCGAWADAAVLRVGTATDRPPLSFQSEGEWVGAEADFARVLATQLGRRLQPVLLPRDQLLPALQRGDVDVVMAGLSIDPSQPVEFTMSYQKAGLMPVIRVVDIMRFRGPGALMQPGYRLGCTRDSGAVRFCEQVLGRSDGVAFDSASEGLQALLDNKIDLLVDHAATSWLLPTELRYGDLMSLDRLLTEEALAWAVRKGDESWRRRLDDELARMRQTGVLQHVIGRWVPVQPQ
jgi:polar amino acid transport system substrate-binding protein